MKLDPVAFGITSVLLTAVSGGSLLFASFQNPGQAALRWWGLSFWLVAGGIGLLGIAGESATPPVLVVGNALIALAFGLQYAGCRALNGRPRTVPSAVLGLAAWLGLWPLIAGSFPARVVVMAAIASLYSVLMVWELWRKAPHRLLSQSAIVAVMSCSAAYFTLRVVFGLVPVSPLWVELFSSRWSSGMGLLLLLYVPVLALLVLSLAKERSECEYRQAALTDPLTRIPNRRAFFLDADEVLAHNGGRPVTCLLFDLDNFKGINDTYGHETGDQVLCALAGTLRDCLPDGAYGRLGGDEFAAILAVDGPRALPVAEKVRSEFLKALGSIPAAPVPTSVSVGCATDVDQEPRELLAAADRALYRAKAGGRNVVSLEEDAVIIPSAYLEARRARRRSRQAP